MRRSAFALCVKKGPWLTLAEMQSSLKKRWKVAQ